MTSSTPATPTSSGTRSSGPSRSCRPNGLTTKLCINDYDVEGLTVQGGTANRKANALYDIVRTYRQYIDCVGFQSHFNDNPNSIISNDLQANIQRFADLGVEVHLTELDIDDDLSNNDIGQGQAENYRKVVRACLNVARCTGITVWGISDSESWRSSERGLLFTGSNGNYQKKAAYTAVLDELNKGRTASPTSPPVSPTSPPVVPTSPPAVADQPAGRRPRTAPASPSVSPSRRRRPAGCSASVSLNSWTGGFVATVRVTAGSAAINGWSVGLTLPSGAAVTNSWNSDRHRHQRRRAVHQRELQRPGRRRAVHRVRVPGHRHAPPASPPPAPRPELVRSGTGVDRPSRTGRTRAVRPSDFGYAARSWDSRESIRSSLSRVADSRYSLIAPRIRRRRVQVSIEVVTARSSIEGHRDSQDWVDVGRGSEEDTGASGLIARRRVR